jgi:hypothetical protein
MSQMGFPVQLLLLGCRKLLLQQLLLLSEVGWLWVSSPRPLAAGAAVQQHHQQQQG